MKKGKIIPNGEVLKEHEMATVQKAAHQSENIIIDLRRIKIKQDKCIEESEKQFRYSKRIKRLIIITKSKKVLE